MRFSQFFRNRTAQRNQRLRVQLQPDDDSDDTDTSDDELIFDQAEPFAPKSDDVIAVRHMFQRRFRLPPELVDMIIDAADYRPLLTASCGEKAEDARVDASRGSEMNATSLYFLSDPVLPHVQEKGLLNIRSVRFSIKSHDQGWGGDPGCPGTYGGSYTWFEAGILRPAETAAGTPVYDHKTIKGTPSEFVDSLRSQQWEFVRARDSASEQKFWKIQNNLCASSKARTHEVEWAVGGVLEETEGRGSGAGFAELLRPGDRIAVFARARVSPPKLALVQWARLTSAAKFPGWQNNVKRVQVHVTYSL